MDKPYIFLDRMTDGAHRGTVDRGTSPTARARRNKLSPLSPLMLQDDDTSPPSRGQSPAPAPTTLGICSRLNLSALNLPRTNPNGVTFAEATIMGIRFLYWHGKSKPKWSSAKQLAEIAKQIVYMNSCIDLPAYQVKLIGIGNVNSSCRVLCGDWFMLVDTRHMKWGKHTVIHEIMHTAVQSLLHQVRNGGASAARAKNFLDKAADIFLQLDSEVIEVRGETLVATTIVDPPTIDPKTPPEHPNKDVDEFLASASAAYVLNRGKLAKTIKKYGKKNTVIKRAGNELVQLLHAYFNRKLDAAAQIFESDPVAINAAWKNIQPKALDEATLAISGGLSEMLLL